MLINCSNHPSYLWGPKQKEAAGVYGEILDMPFPQIDPWLDEDGIRQTVREFASRIEALHADAVLLAGEFTFLFMIVDKLLQDGENVICSCSRRDTEEVLRPDGASEKKAVFTFERFRKYAYYNPEGAPVSGELREDQPEKCTDKKGE
ncbi:MAG: CRISPR-associated protein [Clostridia bacterium]|nr:CRISPR-associated protein [Clostridia bacterium]